MKILAVDFGDARTGLAVSDPTGFLTGETTVLHERDVQKVLDAVTEWAKARNVERIVVGRPVNMNGTEGFRAEKSAVFAEKLGEQSGIPTVLWDERLSSVGANKILSDAGKKKKKQKALVDAVAASLILESYLDFARMQK
ncbi:MAG: Holliday junction resolvase RuvX [Ruminococcaceae bacterium]|nr:Holliday junction resolvase RuvX [Oscillospiraceae bacterium]